MSALRILSAATMLVLASPIAAQADVIGTGVLKDKAGQPAAGTIAAYPLDATLSDPIATATAGPDGVYTLDTAPGGLAAIAKDGFADVLVEARTSTNTATSTLSVPVAPENKTLADQLGPYRSSFGSIGMTPADTGVPLDLEADEPAPKPASPSGRAASVRAAPGSPGTNRYGCPNGVQYGKSYSKRIAIASNRRTPLTELNLAYKDATLQFFYGKTSDIQVTTSVKAGRGPFEASGFRNLVRQAQAEGDVPAIPGQAREVVAPITYGKYSRKICGKGGETAKIIVQADKWGGTVNKGRKLPTKSRFYVCPDAFFTDKMGGARTGVTRGKTIGDSLSIFGVGVESSTSFTSSTRVEFKGGTKKARYYVCGPNDVGPAQASVLYTGGRKER